MNATVKKITTTGGLFRARASERFVVDMDGIHSRPYQTEAEAAEAADRINESCRLIGFSSSREWFDAMNASPMRGADDL